eukprot:2947493-Prymnesium_polylepis.1
MPRQTAAAAPTPHVPRPADASRLAAGGGAESEEAPPRYILKAETPRFAKPPKPHPKAAAPAEAELAAQKVRMQLKAPTPHFPTLPPSDPRARPMHPLLKGGARPPPPRRRALPAWEAAENAPFACIGDGFPPGRADDGVPPPLGAAEEDDDDDGLAGLPMSHRNTAAGRSPPRGSATRARAERAHDGVRDGGGGAREDALREAEENIAMREAELAA